MRLIAEILLGSYRAALSTLRPNAGLTRLAFNPIMNALSVRFRPPPQRAPGKGMRSR